jgi:D-aminoacyl-tRNA deacylase
VRTPKLIAFLQRVSQAWVKVDDREVANIGVGLLILLCAERDDGEFESEKLLRKVLGYRVFADDDGKMNLSLLQMAERAALRSHPGVGLLIVPQFTLAADTQSGTRPSFTPAAPPALGRQLFEHFVAHAKAMANLSLFVETGVFGANMQVGLVNDGPVSFWLQMRKSATS